MRRRGSNAGSTNVISREYHQHASADEPAAMKVDPESEQQRQAPHPAVRSAPEPLELVEQPRKGRQREHLRPRRDELRPRRQRDDEQQSLRAARGATRYGFQVESISAPAIAARSQLQRNQARGAAGGICQPHCRFGEPLVIDPPDVARERIRIGGVNARACTISRPKVRWPNRSGSAPVPARKHRTISRGSSGSRRSRDETANSRHPLHSAIAAMELQSSCGSRSRAATLQNASSHSGSVCDLPRCPRPVSSVTVTARSVA